MNPTIFYATLVFFCGSFFLTGHGAESGPAPEVTLDSDAEIDPVTTPGGTLVISSLVNFSVLDGGPNDQDQTADGVLTLQGLQVRGFGAIVLDVTPAAFQVAGDVELKNRGAIRPPSSPAPALGPTVKLETGQSFRMRSNAQLSTQGESSGGEILVCAGQDIVFEGSAMVLANAAQGAGGSIGLNAGGRIVLESFTVIRAKGASGGQIALVACAPAASGGDDDDDDRSADDDDDDDGEPAILIKGRIHATGLSGPGGTVEVTARQGDIQFHGSSTRILATGTTGNGMIELTAGASVTPNPPPTNPPATVVQNAPSAEPCTCPLLEEPRVSESSPTNGETGVAVTRETIVFFSGPIDGATVNDSNFFATFGGTTLPTRVYVARDGRKATLFYTPHPLPASARIRVTVIGDTIQTTTGSFLDADGDGQPGGTRLIDFDTLGVTAVPGTAVFGRVFASELAEGVGGGSVNVPLQGATITVDGAEDTLRTTTDAMGNFRLDPAPVGRFFVHIDGRTAGNGVPPGAYYPFVGKAWQSVAGRETNVGDVFLPLVPPGTLQPVSQTQDTEITFPQAVLDQFPFLAGTAITVPADSLFADDGTRGGMVGIAAVPPDRIPGRLPEALNFPMVITVQTDGPTNFDGPVAVCFPNLEGLPPGATTALWSFNHDIGDWEIMGQMTITSDGLFACTNPGVGILAPGWHGVQVGVQGTGGPIGGACNVLNDDPAATIVCVDKPVTFCAVIQGPGGTVTWTGGGTPATGTGTTFTTRYSTPGVKTVTATLTPSNGDPPVSDSGGVTVVRAEVMRVENVQTINTNMLDDQVVTATEAEFEATLDLSLAGQSYELRWMFQGVTSAWLGPFSTSPAPVHRVMIPDNAMHRLDEELKLEVRVGGMSGPICDDFTRDFKVLFERDAGNDVHNRPAGNTDPNWFRHWGADHDNAASSFSASTTLAYHGRNVTFTYSGAGGGLTGQYNGDSTNPVVNLYDGLAQSEAQSYSSPAMMYMNSQANAVSAPAGAVSVIFSKRGISLANHVIAHEIEHLHTDVRWMAGGDWFVAYGARTVDDGDGVLEAGENDFDGDELPNLIEDGMPGLRWDVARTHAAFFIAGDDEEVWCEFAGLAASAGNANNDWALPGKQSNPSN